MREILFRGKTEDGKWIEGGYFKYHSLSGEEKPLILEETESGFRYTQVDPETVCQFTGLTDKNGVKAFEGDIIRGTFYGYEHRKAVKWNDNAACFKFPLWDNGAYEVIGNVFDNPELMEGGAV